MYFSRRPALAALCLAFSLPSFAVTPAAATTAATPPAVKCEMPVLTKAPHTDAKAREAAHKGFTFLARASREWTTQHSCFGCHVQAVTMEALSVGKKHQYDVDPKDIDAMVKALKKGVTAGGHSTGVAFEGSAWARFDQWVSANETAELLRYANELVRLQGQDGSIRDDDARLPVTGGTIQTTFQAAQTWRQAYARTADDKWLAPMRRAEQYMAARTAQLAAAGDKAYVQDLNFALLGLVASGVSRTEGSAQKLIGILLERQGKDGGWGLDRSRSDAFATGQTVYALKMAGLSDGDLAITKGTAFLTAAQDASGAWKTYRSGQGGAEKAETMWAVLGLVTVDVASVAVRGVIDGQHVEPKMNLEVEATDNLGGGIKQVQLKVDDVEVKTVCGPKLSHQLDTTALTTGKHIVDLLAVNGKGQESRRRFEVYAGDVFLTGVGAQFDERAQSTLVSVRNIAPEAEKAGAVELEVFTVDGADNAPKKKVFTTANKGTQGGFNFSWDGKDSSGKALPRGKYVAKVSFRDAKGALRQSELAPFFHDSESVQHQKFGEVEGQINTKGGLDLANTTVELVDSLGNVVQRATTTEQGNYRFKTVDKGDYKVRVRKGGFKDQEQKVEVAPAAAPAKASLSL